MGRRLAKRFGEPWEARFLQQWTHGPSIPRHAIGLSQNTSCDLCNTVGGFFPKLMQQAVGIVSLQPFLRKDVARKVFSVQCDNGVS